MKKIIPFIIISIFCGSSLLLGMSGPDKHAQTNILMTQFEYVSGLSKKQKKAVITLMLEMQKAQYDYVDDRTYNCCKMVQDVTSKLYELRNKYEFMARGYLPYQNCEKVCRKLNKQIVRLCNKLLHN